MPGWLPYLILWGACGVFVGWQLLSDRRSRPSWSVRDSAAAVVIGVVAMLLPGADGTLTAAALLVLFVGVGSLPLTLWRHWRPS